MSDEVLVGPNAIAFSTDTQVAAKVLNDFAKNNNLVQIKAGIIDGQVFDGQEVKALAQLPNKEGMIAMLLSVLQAPIRNLACVVKAVSEKEEQE